MNLQNKYFYQSCRKYILVMFFLVIGSIAQAVVSEPSVHSDKSKTLELTVYTNGINMQLNKHKQLHNNKGQNHSHGGDKPNWSNIKNLSHDESMWKKHQVWDKKTITTKQKKVVKQKQVIDIVAYPTKAKAPKHISNARNAYRKAIKAQKAAKKFAEKGKVNKVKKQLKIANIALSKTINSTNKAKKSRRYSRKKINGSKEYVKKTRAQRNIIRDIHLKKAYEVTARLARKQGKKDSVKPQTETPSSPKKETSEPSITANLLRQEITIIKIGKDYHGITLSSVNRKNEKEKCIPEENKNNEITFSCKKQRETLEIHASNKAGWKIEGEFSVDKKNKNPRIKFKSTLNRWKLTYSLVKDLYKSKEGKKIIFHDNKKIKKISIFFNENKLTCDMKYIVNERKNFNIKRELKGCWTAVFKWNTKLWGEFVPIIIENNKEKKEDGNLVSCIKKTNQQIFCLVSDKVKHLSEKNIGYDYIQYFDARKVNIKGNERIVDNIDSEYRLKIPVFDAGIANKIKNNLSGFNFKYKYKSMENFIFLTNSTIKSPFLNNAKGIPLEISDSIKKQVVNLEISYKGNNIPDSCKRTIKYKWKLFGENNTFPELNNINICHEAVIKFSLASLNKGSLIAYNNLNEKMADGIIKKGGKYYIKNKVKSLSYEFRHKFIKQKNKIDISRLKGENGKIEIPINLSNYKIEFPSGLREFIENDDYYKNISTVEYCNDNSASNCIIASSNNINKLDFTSKNNTKIFNKVPDYLVIRYEKNPECYNRGSNNSNSTIKISILDGFKQNSLINEYIDKLKNYKPKILKYPIKFDIKTSKQDSLELSTTLGNCENYENDLGVMYLYNNPDYPACNSEAFYARLSSNKDIKIPCCLAILDKENQEWMVKNCKNTEKKSPIHLLVLNHHDLSSKSDEIHGVIKSLINSLYIYKLDNGDGVKKVEEIKNISDIGINFDFSSTTVNPYFSIKAYSTKVGYSKIKKLKQVFILTDKLPELSEEYDSIAPTVDNYFNRNLQYIAFDCGNNTKHCHKINTTADIVTFINSENK